jgi:hypothetical protein
MKLSRLSVAILVFAATAVMSAQQSITLRVEVFQNQTLVASPELAVPPGELARLDLPKMGAFTFTPTFRNSATVRLAIDFRACGKHAEPILVMAAGKAASASWSCAGETFKVQVTWVP